MLHAKKTRGDGRTKKTGDRGSRSGTRAENLRGQLLC